MNFVYRYPSLYSGKLIKRYKRFLADVELDTGEVVTAHCANTGAMKGLCEPGSLVKLSKSDNPKRKLSYSWEIILVRDSWIGINTALPNRAVKAALEQRLLPFFGDYHEVRSEVPFGKESKSRVDFVLSKPEKKDIYIEVKNVTLAEGSTAMFPDAVTTRGQKHLKELMALPPYCQGVMLYFINRKDCDRFSPSDACDPLYGELLRQAVAAGVMVLPLRFAISPQGIEYIGMAELLL